MYQLTACFEVPLPATCLGKWSNENIIFDCTVDKATVEVELIPDRNTRSKLEDETSWSFPVEKAIIRVTLPQQNPIPPVIVHKDGTRDYANQSPFLRSLLPPYTEAALKVLQRLLKFFRYHLGAPHIEIPFRAPDELLNPLWLNEDDSEVGQSGGFFTVSYVPGLRDDILGIQKLQHTHVGELKHAIECDLATDLFDELLSDARSAILNESLRRAVLELAIACEVLVKESFFSPESAAGAAFEYLERKRKVEVTVPELIDKVAKAAFGKSFKEFNKADYENVDHLFRCRNKVAHRGQLYYLDDSGDRHEPGAGKLQEWFSSILTLKQWLRGVSKSGA